MVKKNFFSVACDFFSFPAFNRGMIQHPFLTLVEEQSAAINRVCRSFCHTTEDCEDLRQDIIMNLWLGWSRYRPTAKPVTWVWRVAVNTGISWRRHRQRQVDTSPLDGIDLPDDGVDYEERKWLYELICQLPDKDQKLRGNAGHQRDQRADPHVEDKTETTESFRHRLTHLQINELSYSYERYRPTDRTDAPSRQETA